MRSTVTPVCFTAAMIRSTSPPGSTTTARLLASSHRMAQFCWNGVTGMIAPPKLPTSRSVQFGRLQEAGAVARANCQRNRCLVTHQPQPDFCSGAARRPYSAPQAGQVADFVAAHGQDSVTLPYPGLLCRPVIRQPADDDRIIGLG